MLLHREWKMKNPVEVFKNLRHNLLLSKKKKRESNLEDIGFGMAILMKETKNCGQKQLSNSKMLMKW